VKQKIILASLMIIALLLAGCAVQQPGVPSQGQETEAPAEPEPAEVTGPEPQPEKEPAEMLEPEPEPEPEPESSYNFESLPKDQQRKIKLVRNLLEEARTKDENYFFRYTGPGIAQTDVWVKGNMIKRQVYRPAELDKFTTYNMVYMNRDTLDAKGYCETSKAKCWKGHGPFTESYNKWMIKTPKDWALEFGDDFTWALDNKIGDQLYHIVDFRKDGKTIRMYVNDYRGIPSRVEIYNRVTPIDSIITGTADETHLYDDMDIGGVSDDDVTPGV
jgi:hypothetical protein